jgi:hypothetical protein
LFDGKIFDAVESDNKRETLLLLLLLLLLLWRRRSVSVTAV